MAFEHYIQSGGKKLRCGYTTGSCAALAATGAVKRLLGGNWPEVVSLMTPKGWLVEVPLVSCSFEDGVATCHVEKDAGEDKDVTAGALIGARVKKKCSPGIVIEGGEGVGRVTKPGLNQPVGAAAINQVPREMIERCVREVAENFDYEGGLEVTIFVPEGERIAERTMNSQLGIVGGISILGTSGIVEPMSMQALVDTIKLELRQVRAQGFCDLILTPGNYGMDYLEERGLLSLGIPVVKCSNFIGETLDEVALLGFKKVLLVGHAGKLIKLAGGIMNTHSSYADCRTELLCAHAAALGADGKLCKLILESATTDACMELLDEAGLREPVLEQIMIRISRYLARRVAGAYEIGTIVFSNVYGELVRNEEATRLLRAWEESKDDR